MGLCTGEVKGLTTVKNKQVVAGKAWESVGIDRLAGEGRERQGECRGHHTSE